MPGAHGFGRGGYRRFLKSWLEDPLAVGAVAPSGRPLCRLMTRDLAAGDRVLELGPGTGKLTQEVLARGVDESALTLLEQSHDFAELLKRSFPRSTVIEGDATLRQGALEELEGKFDSIVSGLPLVVFSREQKRRLLSESFRLLKADGTFVQFTYGGRCPLDRKLLESVGLEAKCVGFIALNIPPAFVYRISRVTQSR